MEQSEAELRANEEIKKINETLRLCKLVEETIQTKGWNEIVEPLIDKMLNDILGSKIDGRWNGGILNTPNCTNSEYYKGYKQALIDLHTRVYAYVDNIKNYEERKEKIIASPVNRFKQPLIDDKRY